MCVKIDHDKGHTFYLSWASIEDGYSKNRVKKDFDELEGVMDMHKIHEDKI